VFETLAEETGSQHWMCRIVSGSGTGTRVYPARACAWYAAKPRWTFSVAVAS